MRRRSSFLSEVWKAVVFVLTIRAIAKPYRSPRLYLGERWASNDGSRTLESPRL